ncbi:hypothetical protein F2Q68_00007545, partial [Brassica cretica]
ILNRAREPIELPKITKCINRLKSSSARLVFYFAIASVPSKLTMNLRRQTYFSKLAM